MISPLDIPKISLTNLIYNLYIYIVITLFPPDLPVKGHTVGYLTVFAALTARPTLLRVFPADHLGPAALKAGLAVLPGTGLIPFGDVYPSNLAEFTNAGAAALGVGSARYKPGWPREMLRFVQSSSWQRGRPERRLRNILRISPRLTPR